ncbi:B3 domain-containing transcription factor VRN1 [Quercus suber]|uniref:B3 domain-containing transcription factor VRN1 n=1 Tax=Quercus suber TaxID=58331 RepID=UPI000D283BD2|nr:b3 domain-containing protein [Quercus suber]
MATKPLEPLKRVKKPSFCKVLIGDFPTQLRIPEAFVEYFDGEVPNSSVLWGPSNSRKTWRVDLKEVENNLFFQEGWSAFVQDNSLEMGDFLLFRYDGSSNFSVKIYGRDCCEKGVAGASRKSYTPVYGNGKEEKEKMRNYLKRKSEQLLVGTGENEEKKKRGYHQKMKREKLLVSTGTNEVDTKEIEVIYIDSDASDDNIGKCMGSIRKERTVIEVIPRHLSCKLPKIQKGARAFEAASKFISNYPSFQVSMYPCYVNSDHLNVPTSFFKIYMEKRERNVTLRTSDKLWTMRLVRYANSMGKVYGKLRQGWHAFAIGNALIVGDVCVFELIDKADGLFKVSIFKSSC